MVETAFRSVQLHNFTVFEDVRIEFSSGLNIVLGVNGTGKTHLLKLLYAAAEAMQPNTSFERALEESLTPHASLQQLFRQAERPPLLGIRVNRDDDASLHLHILSSRFEPACDSSQNWAHPSANAAYLPAKELTAHASDILTTSRRREMNFDKPAIDVLDRAFLPALKQRDPAVEHCLAVLEKEMGGQVVVEGNRFMMATRTGRIDFSLVAEGHRKLGLLWLLLRNGSIEPGSLLFWDEPEANLNPALIRMVTKILLELSRIGVQIFVATHSFFILKYLDLLGSENDPLRFITLTRKDEGGVTANTTEHYSEVAPDPIAAVFDELYGLDLERAIQRTGRG